MELLGTQIKLRHFILEDLGVYQQWNQGKHAWMDLDGPYYPKATPDEMGQILANMEKVIRAGHFPTPPPSLVIADLETNVLLGRVSWYWISRETNWVANGIVIYDPAYWGKGIGYESLGLWNQYLFEAFPKINRLDLRTWSGNQGMMRLATKIGYREEARFRRARIVKGELYDGLGYGILREEWALKYPDGFGKHLTAAT